MQARKPTRRRATEYSWLKYQQERNSHTHLVYMQNQLSSALTHDNILGDPWPQFNRPTF